MNIILIFITLIQLQTLSTSVNGDNSCKSFWYPKDPDFDKPVCDLVVSAGFQCQKYEVITQDGYILSLFRIINPASKTIGKPVLLVHGILCNAAYLIMNAPGNGTEFSKDIFNGQKVSHNLGYALATNGYDVWLISIRGDQNSLKHKTLSYKFRKYWEFSADEIIAYDMPAIIDFIGTKNNSTKMSYVGHSHGTTIIFGLLASIPKYNDIFDIVVTLAPIARLAYVRSPIMRMLMTPPAPQAMYKKGGPFPFGNKTNSNLMALGSLNCPFFNTAFLPFMYGFITGPSTQLNRSRAHVYFKNMGSEAMWSICRNVQHPFSFRHFDYGLVKNFLKYGSILPPKYDLSKIKSPLCFFWGTNDFFVSPKDLDFIRKQLKPNVLVCDYKYQGLNHFDFGLSLNMSNINLRILQLFSKYP